MCSSTQSYSRPYVEWNNQFHAPAALSRGKNHRYPWDIRLGGSQSRSGYFREDKNLLPLQEIEPRFSRRPTRNLVTIDVAIPAFDTEIDLNLLATDFFSNFSKHCI